MVPSSSLLQKQFLQTTTSIPTQKQQRRRQQQSLRYTEDRLILEIDYHPDQGGEFLDPLEIVDHLPTPDFPP